MKNGFKKLAKQHQILFREQLLKVGYDTYKTWLNRTDGARGLNFYDGCKIFTEVQSRYPHYKQQLYSDILRSEHIPFNFFVPFKHDNIFCRNVFNDFFDNSILSIDNLKIEYAPFPRSKYLNDNTSFDTYIEFTHSNGKKGIIGIEVKYTEQDYTLKRNSKEEAAIKNVNSIYYKISNNSKLYKTGVEKTLSTNKFRQVWRNHLLGESILMLDSDKYQLFSSLILYPKGNSHFVETSREYIDLLNKNENNFISVTYEDFLLSCGKHSPNNDYTNWIDYLSKRYIVK